MLTGSENKRILSKKRGLSKLMNLENKEEETSVNFIVEHKMVLVY